MSAAARFVDRRTFWPTVLLGLIGAVVAAWAGHHPWVKAPAEDPFSQAQSNVDSPGITALALVALAAWGVVLVTRGMARRLVAILGVVAAGAPIPAIWATRHHLLSTHDGSHGTGWPWVALAGLVVAVVCFVVAAMKAPLWPEMGAKYDAPTAATSTAPLEEQSSIDLWKSLDEGTDPTVGPAPDPTHESE